MPDEIVRAVLRGYPVRVVAATTTAVTREAAGRHQASAAGTVALGRGLTAGLLLATLTKDDERVSLQVLGDGALGGITVDASAAGTVRAYVKNPDPPGDSLLFGVERPSVGGVVGRHGIVSVIRELGLRENVRGQTAIESGEIDEDVERYLTDSEQIASALRCEVLVAPGDAVEIAGGMLLQALPGGDGAAVVAAARELLTAGRLRRALVARPERAEDLVHAVLDGRFGPVDVLDRRAVTFHCPCSRTRAASSLALLGDAELAAMILEDGKAEVTCNFCRARYDFDDAELETIRRGRSAPSGPPS